MGEGWQHEDLGGGGLQSANIRLAGLLKRRAVAYGLLLAYPLGLHRSYLAHRRGAWFYRGATLVAAAALTAGWSTAGWALAAFITAFALYDLTWIERRVVSLNKQLRMKVYLGQAKGAPQGFKGRFDDPSSDDYLQVTDPERAGYQPQPDATYSHSRRGPSLAEQERLLQQLAPARDNKDES